MREFTQVLSNHFEHTPGWVVTAITPGKGEDSINVRVPAPIFHRAFAVIVEVGDESAHVYKEMYFGIAGTVPEEPYNGVKITADDCLMRWDYVAALSLDVEVIISAIRQVMEVFCAYYTQVFEK